MKNIQKGTEPKSLTQHRCNTNSNYENYAEKDDIRESLVAEQGGICCYCMQRIRPNLESMKIEHWLCQDKYPKRHLDYDNLLGACLGGTGKSRRDQHCDTRKGNDDILFNPANLGHDVENLFKFLGSGLIEANNPEVQSQINDVISKDTPSLNHYSSLNLNHPNLVRNRKAVLDAFTQMLRNEKARDIDLNKYLVDWEGKNGGQLQEYCQVIIYYLRKKLKKKS